MKRLTLDETWVFCLKMWKWIAKEARAGKDDRIESLKREWLNKNGFSDIHVWGTCFFCEYSVRRTNPNTCRLCPAKRVNKVFSCYDEKYCWQTSPLKFYKKLCELNKLRLAKKRKVVKK